jgi:hypothetical protein
VIIKKKFKLS